MIKMTVGERIKNRREEIGMTVDELAEKLGKNRATIYRYERGDIEKLPIEILEPISRALDVSPGCLMGWTDEPQKKNARAEFEITPTERHLVELFRQLSAKEQGNLIGRAELLVEQHREAETEDAG